jgi:hypothetical protein
MDDRFLNEQRREPRPEFSRSLRTRLRAAEPEGAGRPAFRLHPAFSGALAVAALALAFTFPAVRAAAQQVLELFRVREFAVVQIDESRIEKLRAQKFDPETFLGGGAVEKLQEPGPAQRFTDVAAAERAAGFDVLSPTFLARSLSPDTVIVRGEGRMRITIATQPLLAMMDLMEIHDLELPAGLDGQKIEARMPALVVQTYRGTGKRRAALVQSESPEVSMPPGIDLPRLGEIGLRLLGIEKGEARRLAGVIDWHTTLLVPVVASATQFQQVSVNGARGVMLETNSTATPDGSDRGPGKVLMWTRDGRVFALLGNVQELDMVQMAESVR